MKVKELIKELLLLNPEQSISVTYFTKEDVNKDIKNHKKEARGLKLTDEDKEQFVEQFCGYSGQDFLDDVRYWLAELKKQKRKKENE